MDEADLAARQRLLTAELARVLARRWEQHEFTLDVDAAVDRPGEPIVISWQDGPTATDVGEALAPHWTTEADPADHAYPVTLERRYSLVALASVLLALHDGGQLRAAADSGRHAFGELTQQQLAPVRLPDDVDRALLARAALLTQIAQTAVGRDAFAWACWLSYAGGGHILTNVLPGALDDTSHGPGPSSAGSAQPAE
jgi:hypothetical protein